MVQPQYFIIELAQQLIQSNPYNQPKDNLSTAQIKNSYKNNINHYNFYNLSEFDDVSNDLITNQIIHDFYITYHMTFISQERGQIKQKEKV